MFTGTTLLLGTGAILVGAGTTEDGTAKEDTRGTPPEPPTGVQPVHVRPFRQDDPSLQQ